MSVKEYLELLEAAGVGLDDRDIAKLDKMSNEEGLIERSVFLAYAKKSSLCKSLLDAEKHQFDKAELAFKVGWDSVESAAYDPLVSQSVFAIME